VGNGAGRRFFHHVSPKALIIFPDSVSLHCAEGVENGDEWNAAAKGTDQRDIYRTTWSARKAIKSTKPKTKIEVPLGKSVSPAPGM